MSTEPSAEQLKLITWNVDRTQVLDLGDELSALQDRMPDIVALQGVRAGVREYPRRLLREYGFEYAAHSHDIRVSYPDTSSGCAFVSRWPFRLLSPDTFEMPFQHYSLSAEFFTPFGRIEGHTVEIKAANRIGPKNRKMFEAIYDRLAVEDPPEYRFLCGDFHSPREESADGEVRVWGGDRQWAEAERNVMVGLADYDLTDAYRAVNGYDEDAHSYLATYPLEDCGIPRRFDHVFASQQLNATEATYRHEYDEYAEHTPLEVVFTPADGLHDEVDSIDRDPLTLATDSTTPESFPAKLSKGPVLGFSDGLTYEEDARTIVPEDDHRREQFKHGWEEAVNGIILNSETLRRLSWENLGWRLGRVLGETSEARMEALYDWCVQQQQQVT